MYGEVKPPIHSHFLKPLKNTEVRENESTPFSSK